MKINKNPNELINQVIKNSLVEKAHEENFYLSVKVKQGESSTCGNYATVLSKLESLIRHSQHNQQSIIVDFHIKKIEKDKNGNIVKSTLILNKKS